MQPGRFPTSLPTVFALLGPFSSFLISFLGLGLISAASNHIAISNLGGVKALVALLASSSFPDALKHALSALMNLSSNRIFPLLHPCIPITCDRLTSHQTSTFYRSDTQIRRYT